MNVDKFPLLRHPLVDGRCLDMGAFHDTLQILAFPTDGPFLDFRRRHGWMVDIVSGFDKGVADDDGVGNTAFHEAL